MRTEINQARRLLPWIEKRNATIELGLSRVSIVSKTFRETRDKDDLKTTLAPGKLVLTDKVRGERVDDSILSFTSGSLPTCSISRARVDFNAPLKKLRM